MGSIICLTPDGSVERDTDSTDVISGHRGYLAGAPGTVLIIPVISGGRIVIVAVNVETRKRILSIFKDPVRKSCQATSTPPPQNE